MASRTSVFILGACFCVLWATCQQLHLAVSFQSVSNKSCAPATARRHMTGADHPAQRTSEHHSRSPREQSCVRKGNSTSRDGWSDRPAGNNDDSHVRLVASLTIINKSNLLSRTRFEMSVTMPAGWKDTPKNRDRWVQLQNSNSYLNHVWAKKGELRCHYCGLEPLHIVSHDDRLNQNHPRKVGHARLIVKICQQ